MFAMQARVFMAYWLILYLEPKEVLILRRVLIQALLARFSLNDTLFPICRSPIIHLVCLPAVNPPPPLPPAQSQERKKERKKKETKDYCTNFVFSFSRKSVTPREIRGAEWGLPLAVK